MDDCDSRHELAEADADEDGVTEREVAPGFAVTVVERADAASHWQTLGALAEGVFQAAKTVAVEAGPEVARLKHKADFERISASIILADDAEVRALNQSWRGQDKPTNVLSFPNVQPLPPDLAVVLRAQGGHVGVGDVVLAAETVLREAGELGIPPRHHLQHLVIHGLLHLLGFDHETDEDAAEMEALETRLLAGLGVADPYGEPAA